MRRFTAGLATLVLLAPGGAIFPASAEPSLPLSVSIALETYDAHMFWNGSDDTVSFNGTISLDDPLEREIDVTLQAFAPAGWGASCSPPVNKFYRSGERPFTLNIRVAGVWSNMTGNLTVQGMAVWRGDTLASNQSPPLVLRVTKLTVEPYYNRSDLNRLSYEKRLGLLLPEILLVAAVVAAVAVPYAIWRWRKGRSRGEAAP